MLKQELGIWFTLHSVEGYSILQVRPRDGEYFLHVNMFSMDKKTLDVIDITAQSALKQNLGEIFMINVTSLKLYFFLFVAFCQVRVFHSLL
jgi:hypothetical protein